MAKRYIILILMFSFFGNGCSSQENRPEFVLAIESFPSSLDPRYPLDAYSSKVQALIFSGLLKYDKKLLLVPDLAESYEYITNNTLRFILRKDAIFHNGKKLTADDVIYTFQSMTKPGARSPRFGIFNKISQIKKINEYQLEIELKEPFAPFLTALTVGIVPRGSFENSKGVPFGENPVGTGPFQFVSQKNGQWILLKSFPKYFDAPPIIKFLKIQTVADDTTRVLKLLRGEVDLVQNAIPLVMAHWLMEKGGLNMETDTGINYSYLGFNLRDPILKTRKVREAIGLALNRNLLIKYQLKGFARPATGILAPRNWFYENNVHQINYDPELAKQLLESAGFPDPDGEGPQKRFTITYKTSNKRDRIAMARAISRQLEAVGIGVKLQSYEWGTFFRDIRTGNFQMYSSSWVGVTEPDIFYEVFHSQMIPPEGRNRGYYKNEQLDTLVEMGRSETDNSERKKYYSQVQKMLSLDLPYIDLWYEDNVVFTQPDVMGYLLRPDASLIGLVKVKLEQAEN